MILGLWIAVGILLVLLLVCSFLVLGTLRRVELLTWRIEQIEYKTPHRIGRDGLRPGSKAPDFDLENLNGRRTTLGEFKGRDVLLVFTQDGCGPCHHLIQELKQVERGGLKILVINHGDRNSCKEIASLSSGIDAEFLIQSEIGLWKKYEAMATPFLFLIDSAGNVCSRGIAHSRQQIQFILDGEGQKAVPMPTLKGLSTESENAHRLDPVAEEVT